MVLHHLLRDHLVTGRDQEKYPSPQRQLLQHPDDPLKGPGAGHAYNREQFPVLLCGEAGFLRITIQKFFKYPHERYPHQSLGYGIITDRDIQSLKRRTEGSFDSRPCIHKGSVEIE